MMDLAAFVENTPIRKRRSLAQWLHDRPKVRDEVLTGLSKDYPMVTVWKWLRTEHGLPFGYSTFTVFCSQILDTPPRKSP